MIKRLTLTKVERKKESRTIWHGGKTKEMIGKKNQ